MPSSTLIPFLGGLDSLINPFKQKRAPLFKPWLLGSLVAKYLRVVTWSLQYFTILYYAFLYFTMLNHTILCFAILDYAVLF